MSIPYRMRNLYIHTFTSLLWNQLTSYRILRYGFQPVIGDLVLTDIPTEPSTNSRYSEHVHVYWFSEHVQYMCTGLVNMHVYTYVLVSVIIK